MAHANTRPNVLVIDDDDEGRVLTALILEERGFDVSQADSGEQAIASVEAGCPDIVLLDALMPGLDGFETCRRIRALGGAEHLPILMLTGLNDDRSITSAYAAGATDFFVKSTHWTLLTQRIDFLLQAKRMRDELTTSRVKEARAQRIAGVGYWEWDVVNQRFTASEECVRLIGRPDLPGSFDISVCEVANLFQHLHAADCARVEEVVARTLRDGGTAQFECGLTRTDGSNCVVQLEIEVERIPDGTMSRVHGVLRDITERKRSEEQVRLLANFDSLTGLPNRHLFKELLSEAIKTAQTNAGFAALMIVDLDRFKQINDNFGHAAGDELLQEVGLRLNNWIDLRTHNSGAKHLVGRLGGDEFAVMLIRLDSISDADTMAQEILAALRKPINLAGQECIISASIGVSAFPLDGNDSESLMRCADIAKNTAKANGKNTFQLYQSGLNAAAKERMNLEQALHKALERDELVMYYQPQIDMRLNTIVGAEALMRWRRDDRLVQPGDFISIAEDTGLIYPFGEWAIDNVLAQDRAWIDAGFPPLTIAVNIPGGHFERSNFIELVKQILVRHRLDPEQLELEITETSLIRNLESTLPVLDALTATGIGLSVDDFGTGYSSLSYLRRLPIDTLKIDASFVRELTSGSENEAIVAAIIAMAKSLNLRIIAEGVETAEQMTLLIQYGCYLMQGYYFSRPVPAADFARFRLQYAEKNAPLDVPAVAGPADRKSGRDVMSNVMPYQAAAGTRH